MPFGNACFIKPDAEFVWEFARTNLAPMFRKCFNITSRENAKLQICGLGYAHCYINGQQITEDLFTAAVSDYGKTLWYHTYDVTDLLVDGENTIAVICGSGWYNESFGTSWNYNEAAWRDNPKLILRLEAAGNEVLVTDGSWKCKPDSAIFFNQLRLGEYFDANLYEENWNLPEYDDSSWGNAVVDTNQPTGVFRECTCEPIREHAVYTPVSVIKNGEDSYLYDMGQNMSGYIRLTAWGNSGDELTIRYAECINEAQQLEYYDMERYYRVSGFHTDKFICSGKQMTWSPRFVYHGFRYIQISGLKDPERTDVKAVFVHQAVARRTSFRCSDPYFNRLFDFAILSSQANMFYMITDCPTREKLGWANDAQSSCEQLLTNFAIEKLLTKWHQDIRDAMRPDGSLPGIIPTAGWGYHWGNGPVSDGILFEIPYRVYLHTGDSSLLKMSLPYFEKYLDYLDSRKNEEGLVEFGLNDWAAPGGNSKADVGFINAVLIYVFCRIAALAEKLAESPLAEHYTEKAESQKVFLKEKYLAEDGSCRINGQCAVAMLIYYGIYDNLAPLKKQLATLLEETDYHLDCGMVGMRRLLHALSKCGLTDYGVKLMKAEGYPGYKIWMDNGATTLWEKWDYNVNADSKNHHMYSDFASWFVKTFAGFSLNEEKCGELEFLLDPCFTESLSWVEFSCETAAGFVSINWKREGDRILLDVKKDESLRLMYRGKAVEKDGFSIVM